ncbi:hypothetical protein MtrunA17_Chr8g0390671 [Medicago truncatula]|uniref:Transmembrane protein n=1 Tax=Medicago truncatula TaxID=3880 RepID=A0A396GRA6_MEDTR|nr:hypothetical protein MtrunA17_Chr8g0390671 [Medicago truncatula]
MSGDSLTRSKFNFNWIKNYHFSRWFVAETFIPEKSTPSPISTVAASTTSAQSSPFSSAAFAHSLRFLQRLLVMAAVYSLYIINKSGGLIYYKDMDSRRRWK